MNRTTRRFGGELINQTARLYDKLIDALQLINKCYSIQVTHKFSKIKLLNDRCIFSVCCYKLHFQVMFNIGICFSYTVCFVFTFYRKIVILNNPPSFKFFIIQLAWIGYYFMTNIVIIHVASATTREVRFS